MRRGWTVGALGALLGALGACGATSSEGAATTGSVGSGNSGNSVGSGGSGATGANGASAGGSGTTASSSSGGGLVGPIGGDRPVAVIAPPGYDPAKPAPLLILLHGYSASGGLQEFYLDLGSEAAARGYLFAHPNGTIDKTGLEFWNATDACCNFFDSKVDDSAYLATVVAQIRQAFAVDPKRIFFMGHSNGGFMSHRMACEHADTIAAIATLAGSTFDHPAQCAPSEPVSALVVHGTLDPVILYGGGELFGNAYPSAFETAQRWAHLDGCATTADESAPKLDLVGLPLAETKVMRFPGCDPGIGVEHWRIEGAQHVPLFKQDFKERLFDFFDAHPKP